MKKAISMLIVTVFIVIAGMFEVFAIPVGTDTVIKSNINLSKVLNVYTSGTPSSGNNVTLYTANNSFNNNTQCWVVSELDDNYYTIWLECDGDLGLNINQATSKCTVYSIYDNFCNGDYDDYQITFSHISGNTYAILLPGWHRYLSHSGDYNGSQCYWISDANGYNSNYYWYFAT